METLKEIRKSIESIVQFSRDTLTIQDVSDEIRVLYLLCRKGVRSSEKAIFVRIESDLQFINRLLIHLRILITNTEGAGRAVSENFKALIYATLEHVALRIGISASSHSTLTFFTNVLSFLLNRVAEYSYVRSARESQDLFFSQARTYLWEDLWEATERNQTITDITYSSACGLKKIISALIDSIDRSRSEEVYVRLYSIMVYIYLLNVVNNIEDWIQSNISG